VRFLKKFRRRKYEYQPAIARIEGGGIKRGLSAPEVSVVLGKSLDLTLGLMFCEMLRKGFIDQLQLEPLIVRIADEFIVKEGGKGLQEIKQYRRLAAQSLSAALNVYEEALLELIEEQGEVEVGKLDISIAIQPFIRYVASRIGGYSLAETRAYYEALIERAPKEARSDGVLTHDRERVFDRNYAMVLLNADYSEIFDKEDYSYKPVWWRKSKMTQASISFATWFSKTVESFRANPSLESVKVDLGDEEDLLSATLMNDIAQATFYG